MNSIFEKNKENLKKFILNKGEKPYRADQIWRSMYVDLYDNFNDISTIPDKLKKSLNNELEFSPLKLVVKKKSKDKSTDTKMKGSYAFGSLKLSNNIPTAKPK